MSHKKLSSWGRFPAQPQIPLACDWRSEIPAALAASRDDFGSTLAFGNGRSYGDSCMASSNHVLHMCRLNRFMAFDAASGIIRAEAGVTLEEIIHQCLPQGWFLPVTPGTQFVTLGGAVANDVHGKNHHVRGTFGRHIRRFSLLRSDHAACECSPLENADLFRATIGGLGLTGIIEWVELQLMPVRSSHVDTLGVRFDSLDEFFALSHELDAQHEYAVAWVDCLARGKSAGRGIYSTGDHCHDDELDLQHRRKLAVPFTPPLSTVNALSLRAFNNLYFRLHKAGRVSGRQYFEPFFYPLDRILNWNRIYGPRGFQQYQCVIPEAEASAAIRELLDEIARAGSGSFLAVLKRCGDLASPGLLSFPLAGTSLALDFAQTSGNAALLPRLDAIARTAGGRLYPAKDAHMSGTDFRHFYPAWQQLEALRDPALNSHFWKRVTHS